MRTLAIPGCGRRRHRWRLGSALTAVAVVVGGGALLPATSSAAVAAGGGMVPAGDVEFGGTPGSLSVGDSGAAQYEVPLAVVPGRGGFEPKLSLRYSSETADGIVGVGFGLTGVSQISRCDKTIADDTVALGVRLDATDRFCLDGQKLVAVGGTYGADGTEYRTKHDTQVRVKSFRTAGTPASMVGPTHFTVWRADGTVQQYGTNTTTTQVARGINLVNVSWALERAEDRSKNLVVYRYSTRVDQAYQVEIERWLDSIEYGRAESLDRLVEFGYELRPDKRFGFAYGMRRERLRRLSSVTMSVFAEGTWKRARGYTLSYDNAGATKRSRLALLKECGVDSDDCKRPTIFKWTGGATGFASGVTQVPSAGSLVPTSRDSQVIAADLNGDGRTDLAWPEADRWRYTYAQPTSSGNAFKTAVDADNNGYGVHATAYPIDYNLDGRADLLAREPITFTWRPALTRPDGTVIRAETEFLGPFNQTQDSAGAMTGDFDGDGYQDVLQYRKNDDDGNFTWSWRRRSGTVNPLIDSAAPYDDAAFAATQPLTWLFTPDVVVVADLTGDGRDEVVTKDGSFDLPTGAWDAGDGPGHLAFKLDLKFLDLNGDGMLDVVTNGKNGVKENFLYYKLNRGDGSFGLDTPMNIGAGGFTAADLVDADGDGRQELLIPRASNLPSTGGPQYVGMDLVTSGFNADGTLSFTKVPTSISFMARSLDSLKKQGTRVVDADGDGLDDVVLVDRPDPGATGPVNLLLFPHLSDGSLAGDKPDLLFQVYEGTQAPKTFGDLPPTWTVKYAPLTEGSVYDVGDCPRFQGLSCLVGSGMFVVKQVRRDAGVNGLSAELVSNYFYRNGRVGKSSRAFLGFAERRVTTIGTGDPHGPVVDRYFATNTAPSLDPRLKERWTIRQLNGRQSLDRTVLSWNEKATTAQSSFSYVSTTLGSGYEFPVISGLATMSPASFDQLGKSPFTSTLETVSGMDPYGNAGTVVTEASGKGNTRTEVVTTPDVDATQWLIRRPTRIVTKDATYEAGAGWRQQIRTVDHTYQPGSDRPGWFRSVRRPY